MGIDVFDPSCREFFSGHFKTKDFFVDETFSKKPIFRSNFRDFTGSHEASSSDSV
jgi:hypothetical protein